MLTSTIQFSNNPPHPQPTTTQATGHEQAQNTNPTRACCPTPQQCVLSMTFHPTPPPTPTPTTTAEEQKTRIPGHTEKKDSP